MIEAMDEYESSPVPRMHEARRGRRPAFVVGEDRGARGHADQTDGQDSSAGSRQRCQLTSDMDSCAMHYETCVCMAAWMHDPRSANPVPARLVTEKKNIFPN